MTAPRNDEPPRQLDLTRTIVDYPSADPEAHPELRTGALVWLSLPACIGAGLLAATIHAIRANPADDESGANLFVALIAVLLISGITSGAAVLAVFDSRKTIVNVFFLALNLSWLAVCVCYLFVRRIH